MSVERQVKGRLRTASMYLGSPRCGASGDEGRIEPLDVADLQHEIAGRGRRESDRRHRPR